MKSPFFYAGEYNYIYQQTLLRDYNVIFSDQFMICADLHLRKDFEIRTGIKIDKNVGFSIGDFDRPLDYKKGPVSEFTQALYINHNWNDATVMWKSISGRIYETHDTDIDCDDIVFWFKELDVPLIYKQLYPGDKLPFKLKDLTYELAVQRINLDCRLVLHIRAERIGEIEGIIDQADHFIDDFNIKSESKDRKYGVIHNWKTNIEDNKVIYDIDLGSTGPHFFKKLLPYLSGLNCFEKVELC